MSEFENAAAFIVGGTAGIGLASAKLLAERGARVEVFGAPGGHDHLPNDMRVTTGDVRDAAAIRAAIDGAAERLGGLSVLVNSAGIQRYGDVEATSIELWNEVIGVNVTGMFLACQAAMPHLVRAGGGAIVNIASVQAHVTQEHVTAYATSKAAIVGMTRSIAIDYAARGVRANTVSPGSVDTPMLRGAADLFRRQAAADDIVASWGTAHPLGRVAQPSEIAEVVAFLASERASFVTAADWRVDGGLLGVLPVATSAHVGR